MRAYFVSRSLGGWLNMIVFVRYGWAAPATAVGLLLTGFASALGATVRSKHGVVEVGGGRLARVVGRGPFVAITFGHVVLGLSHDVLARMRAHEHAHVRQYEHWGVFFFPLYVGSSLAQLARGRDPYRHNAFERQARIAASNAAGSM